MGLTGATSAGMSGKKKNTTTTTTTPLPPVTLAPGAPRLGMLVDRSSFDETESYGVDPQALETFFDTQKLYSPQSTVDKNGRVRRRMRWRPKTVRHDNSNSCNNSAAAVVAAAAAASTFSKRQINNSADASGDLADTEDDQDEETVAKATVTTVANIANSALGMFAKPYQGAPTTTRWGGLRRGVKSRSRSTIGRSNKREQPPPPTSKKTRMTWSDDSSVGESSRGSSCQISVHSFASTQTAKRGNTLQQQQQRRLGGRFLLPPLASLTSSINLRPPPARESSIINGSVGTAATTTTTANGNGSSSSSNSKNHHPPRPPKPGFPSSQQQQNQKQPPSQSASPGPITNNQNTTPAIKDLPTGHNNSNNNMSTGQNGTNNGSLRTAHQSTAAATTTTRRRSLSPPPPTMPYPIPRIPSLSTHELLSERRVDLRIPSEAASAIVGVNNKTTTMTNLNTTTRLRRRQTATGTPLGPSTPTTTPSPTIRTVSTPVPMAAAAAARGGGGGATVPRKGAILPSTTAFEIEDLSVHTNEDDTGMDTDTEDDGEGTRVRRRHDRERPPTSRPHQPSQQGLANSSSHGGNENNNSSSNNNNKITSSTASTTSSTVLLLSNPCRFVPVQSVSSMTDDKNSNSNKEQRGKTSVKGPGTDARANNDHNSDPAITSSTNTAGDLRFSMSSMTTDHSVAGGSSVASPTFEEPNIESVTWASPHGDETTTASAGMGVAAAPTTSNTSVSPSTATPNTISRSSTATDSKRRPASPTRKKKRSTSPVILTRRSNALRATEQQQQQASGSPASMKNSAPLMPRSPTASVPVDVDDATDLDVEKNLHAIHEIGIEHLRHNENAEALEVFEEILRGQLTRYGKDHPRVGTALHNIGVVQMKRGDYTEAAHACREAVRVRQLALGKEHPDLSVSLAQLGVAYLELGKNKKAIVNFRQALRIRRLVYGPKHAKVAKILNNIGCALYELDELQVAKVAFDEALEIQRETFCIMRMMEKNSNKHDETSRPSSPTKKDSNNNTALSNVPQDDTPNQVLLSIASTLSNIGSIQLYWGAFEKARIDLKEAMFIQQSVLGHGHPLSQRTVKSLEWLNEHAMANANNDKSLSTTHATTSYCSFVDSDGLGLSRTNASTSPGGAEGKTTSDSTTTTTDGNLQLLASGLGLMCSSSPVRIDSTDSSTLSASLPEQLRRRRRQEQHQGEDDSSLIKSALGAMEKQLSFLLKPGIEVSACS